LHIVVYTKRTKNQKQIINEDKISDNVWAYPTNSVAKLFYFWDAYGLCEKLLKKNPRMLVTSQDAITNLLALQLKIQFSFPLQVQIHTDYNSPHFKTESIKNFIRYWGYEWGVRKADCIRVVSKRIAGSMKDKKYKLKAEPEVLPIYVNIEKIRQTQTSFSLHQKYSQFDFIILMVSRLTKEKNIPLALRVFKEIAKKYPKTGLVIVGDGPEFRSLRETSESLQLQEGVVFEGWVEDSVLYYKTADMFLLVSNYEGYGLSLVEAAASGLPIVTTDVGIAGEILKDGESALFCEPGDSRCITEKIIALQESPQLRNKLKLRAQEQLESVNITKEEYLRLYKETLERC